MDYENMLEWLLECRDELTDAIELDRDDPEVLAHNMRDVKIVNGIIELVRQHRDEQDDAEDEAWNNALADEGPVDE